MAFLATVRPRRLAARPPGGVVVHSWADVRLDATSPKVRDLQRDPRYALHSMMDNFEAVGGEFFVAGRAARVDDPTLIATASAGKHDPEEYVLFEFRVEEAIGTTHEETNRSVALAGRLTRSPPR
ncbi:MAG TPA: hypothetical protein VGR41_06825 [Actinomycetota bacterium]|nr:hypothetical protein [Actinomycetota bacterium]